MSQLTITVTLTHPHEEAQGVVRYWLHCPCCQKVAPRVIREAALTYVPDFVDYRVSAYREAIRQRGADGLVTYLCTLCEEKYERESTAMEPNED